MGENRRKYFLNVFLVFVFFFVNTNLAMAHDLWLNVDNHYPKVGEKTTVKVLFGHNFPYYDILITRDKLTGFSYLCPDGQIREVEKTWEDNKEKSKEGYGYKTGALAGDITLDQKGTYVVAASRKVKGDREHVTSEKYGKSIIIAGKGNEMVSKPFGHRIEIVPLKNPSEIKPGDEFPVRVLFEGQPLSTYVYSTYAGYFSEDEPFPFFTKSNEDGVAYMKIPQAGIWLLVCNHKVDFSASLTFKVAGEPK
ncbi:MAG TPA: hypothetical protein DCY25_04130 [Bacteroidales bacterium]|nr:hypothetical protein [Bacteroidales bacterium]